MWGEILTKADPEWLATFALWSEAIESFSVLARCELDLSTFRCYACTDTTAGYRRNHATKNR
jgi:hypothetical protein